MFDRPRVVAFDANETLFSLEPLRPRLKRIGLEERHLELWFAQLLREGFALSAAGAPRTFLEVAEATLRVLLAIEGVEAADRVDEVLAAFSELPAQPDAQPAFEALRDAGIRVVILTNGGEANCERLLERARLQGLVERVFSVDAVGPWKPFRDPYIYALRELDVQPEELALISVHGWDIQGATAVGLTTAWVSRKEKLLLPLAPPPAVVGADLLEVTRSLINGPVTRELGETPRLQ